MLHILRFHHDGSKGLILCQSYLETVHKALGVKVK